MKLHAELIFIWKVLQLDSLWNRGTGELEKGRLAAMLNTLTHLNKDFGVVVTQ